LEERERDLENRCMLLKQKADGYQQIFALCEQIARLGINSDQIELVLQIIIKIAKRNANNSVSEMRATAEATSRFSDIVKEYETIEELDRRAEVLTTQINTLTKQLEGLNNFWMHKQHTIKSLIELQCKGVLDKHILYIHNFFSKYSDKIELESLFNDLEQYANLKEALEELSKEVSHMRIEISLLQEKKQRIKEKSHIMYLNLIKRKEMMRQLAERVAKAAAAFNLPSFIFSTDTKIVMLSNIITQKSEEKEKTAAGKITRYTRDGKAIL
jgi:predicted  nucleic acid-binding Zn-ribbon protein